ncbi:hypothetical protein HF078_10865 [Bacillus sp. RO2]|uniref:hypothetical protein n=1 Tax=Bacillus sp. RO2 TaxID=2723913 RepID=UPI00145D6729|nr:hypothetical protein [Bacillus sp. RO2]NMH73578.1 hypothetical protein [Bacillus sp. RO2]
MWIVVSLIPMPFLFHYYEISQHPERADFLFIGILLFAGLVGFLSLKVKVGLIILVNLITIIVSVWLGTAFITPPNEGWFKPIGMNFAIVLTGVVLVVVVLVLRSVFKHVFSRE